MEVNKVYCGDCQDILKTLPENSVDSICCDPPYELGFMGKSWDNTGIANNQEMWKECLRVLKPGGHLLAFSGTRTYHRMASAIEDAGFEVRDMIEWCYGSGFPKSLNIGKAVDKTGGQSLSWFIDYILEVADKKGISRKELTMLFPSKNGNPTGWLWNKQKTQGITLEQYHKIKEFLQLPFADISECEREVIGRGKAGLTAGTIANFAGEKEFNITKGTSEWEGWGTALKPAHEPICMARKPLGYWETKNTLTAKERDEFQDLWDKMEAGMPYDEKRYEELWAKKEVKVFKSLSVAENCLKYGTGGINIDESRVEYQGDADFKNTLKSNTGNIAGGTFKCSSKSMSKEEVITPSGRFPANLIHDNSEEVRECFPENNVKGSAIRKNKVNPYGGERTWSVSDTPAQDTVGYADSGNASRFFKSIIYQAKASKSERNKGMDDIEEKEWKQENSPNPNRENRPFIPVKNNHPTVKPIALMEYLIKMVTPKGGIVLDPFAGSGSTLVAAKQNGFQYIGIEMTEEYIPIIEARLSS